MITWTQKVPMHKRTVKIDSESYKYGLESDPSTLSDSSATSLVDVQMRRQASGKQWEILSAHELHDELSLYDGAV